MVVTVFISELVFIQNFAEFSAEVLPVERTGLEQVPCVSLAMDPHFESVQMHVPHGASAVTR